MTGNIVLAAATAEALFLGLFMVVGLLLVPQPGSLGLHAEVVVGAAGVSGMAIQTAVTPLAGHLFPANMVTGTMTQLGMDTARLLFLQDGSDDERAVVRGAPARTHAWSPDLLWVSRLLR